MEYPEKDLTEKIIGAAIEVHITDLYAYRLQSWIID